MGFFKDFKEDLSQAVNELSDDAAKIAGAGKAEDKLPEDDAMVNTLAEEETDVTDADLEASLSRVLAQEAEPEIKEDAKPSVKEEKDPVRTARKDKESPAKESPAKEEPEEPAKDAASDETAIITPGLSIKGDINSAGSIELLGKVEGNVNCKGKLVVSGVIKGNSASADFFSDKAEITGDITCNGPAKIGSGSVIIGNLVATSAVIAGAIKGDIDVQGPVIVDTTAIVMGNIKSKLVQINNGAVIEGYCSQCYSDNSPKKFFGEM